VLPLNSLADWLTYISGQHPKNIALGLDRVRTVWNNLGAPAPAQRVVSVAGTNGKGSSVAILQAILQSAGYRVGAYTSPHVLEYNERVNIDGSPVNDENLCEAFAQIEAARGTTPLTYFEYGTLAALWLFQQSALDIALLEVGLGGRLDAVNIIDADVALITGIALDHMDWLGDNLEVIGTEKAGIMRKDRPVIYAAPEMPESIATVAYQTGARLLRLNKDYHYRVQQQAWHWTAAGQHRRSLPLPNLRGTIQMRNAAAALQVLACLQDSYPVDQQAIRQGLLGVTLPGRFAIYQRRARWIIDVAHNPQAAEGLAVQLSDCFIKGKTLAVVGVLEDKLQPELFTALKARVDHWYLLDLRDAERGASAQAVLECAQQSVSAEQITVCGEPNSGFNQVDMESTADDQVLVFGSFVTVTAVMRWLREVDER
jgi:dihydrofolate synthase/folylpolyglutamate synthase